MLTNESLRKIKSLTNKTTLNTKETLWEESEILFSRF